MRKKYVKNLTDSLVSHRNSRRISKRGQMEMIGLVVIVILITLGMLFMAQFALKSEPKKSVFVRKGLAYSTMGALMKTSVECNDYGGYGGLGEMKWLDLEGELIEDCAENYDARPDYSGFRCGQGHSCDFLTEFIKDKLDKTLGKWGKHYEFHSKLQNGADDPTIIEIKDGGGGETGCLGRPVDVDSSGPFPISTNAGLVENILYLCD